MNAYLAFTIAAVITYALRASMTIAGSRITRSEHLGPVIGLATPAVLAAMITSALATHHGQIGTPVPVEVASVALAFVVARKTGNLGLDFDGLSEVMADLKSIDAQLGSSRPKTAIIRECFRSIMGVLQKTGDTDSLTPIKTLVGD